MCFCGLSDATYTRISNGITLLHDNDVENFPASWTTLAGNGSINFVSNDDGYDTYIMVNITGKLATNYLSVINGDEVAWRAGIGNITFSNWNVSANAVQLIGPFETARFNNATGFVQISSKNLTGKVAFLKRKD